MNTFGVIGAGHLASYTIAAMRNSGFTGCIALSPRGAATAQEIAKKHDCTVMQSNQAVVDNADCILLAVRPDSWQAALESIALSQKHVLLSAVAGVSIEQLKSVCGINSVIRIMPSSFIEHGNPFIPAYPHNHSIVELFGKGCPIVTLDSEQQLDESMFMSCAYAWQFGFMQQMQDWFVAQGWSESTARELIVKHWQGAVHSANGQSQDTFSALLGSIATPGTYTELGFNELKEHGGLDALTAALEHLKKNVI